MDGPGAPHGLLLYVKATLSGDESVDVRNFAALHPAFPHDPTGNQFFDEDRFESYRALGYHSIMTLAGELDDADAWELCAAVERLSQSKPSFAPAATAARHNPALTHTVHRLSLVSGMPSGMRVDR